MALVVLGGSNSRYRSGWVGNLEHVLGHEVRNLSIGATTSLTAIYRTFLEDGARRGDTVIWEYALNEVNHIKGGYEIDHVLKSVEHLLRICRRDGIRFAPAVFTPLREEAAEERSRYYRKLMDLFEHYGIAYFDVSPAFRSLKGLQRLPDDHFADEQHYAKLPDLMQFIAEGAADLASRATVPDQAAPIYTGQSEVSLLSPAKTDIYENSVMRVPVARVPLRLEAASPGRLLAIMALCRPDEECGLRARISLDGRERRGFRFSATSHPSFPKPILKAVSLERATGAAWPVEPGESIIVAPAKMGGRFFNEYLTLKMLSNPVKQPKAGVCGFLIEKPLERHGVH